MSISLRKVGAFAFIAGFSIPFFVEILGRCLDSLNLHPGMWLSTVYICLWPTGLYLISTSNDWKAYFAFFLTAILNGVLYSFAAVLVAYYIKLIKNRGWDLYD